MRHKATSHGTRPPLLSSRLRNHRSHHRTSQWLNLLVLSHLPLPSEQAQHKSPLLCSVLYIHSRTPLNKLQRSVGISVLSLLDSLLKNNSGGLVPYFRKPADACRCPSPQPGRLQADALQEYPYHYIALQASRCRDQEIDRNAPETGWTPVVLQQAQSKGASEKG